MSSAAEAEIGALFINAKLAVPIRQALIEMGHPQPPTKIKTDNSTAEGFVNDKIKQNRSKAINMRYYWLRDQRKLTLFDYYWRKGQLNIADYFSKHFPAPYHLQQKNIHQHQIVDRICQLCSLMSEYIEELKAHACQIKTVILAWRGCVNNG